MQHEVNIIVAVSEALKFRKQKPLARHEEILEHINSLIRQQRDENTKLGMIVATNRALDFLDKNPEMNDKTALQHVMANLPEILASASGE